MGGWIDRRMDESDGKQRKQKYIYATDKKMYSLPRLFQQNSVIIYSHNLFFDETDQTNTRFKLPLVRNKSILEYPSNNSKS